MKFEWIAFYLNAFSISRKTLSVFRYFWFFVCDKFMRNMKQFVHNNFQLLFFFLSFFLFLCLVHSLSLSLALSLTYWCIIVYAFARTLTHHILLSLPCRYFLFCWNNKKKLALLRRFHIDKFTSCSWWERVPVSVCFYLDRH